MRVWAADGRSHARVCGDGEFCDVVHLSADGRVHARVCDKGGALVAAANRSANVRTRAAAVGAQAYERELLQ